MNKLFLIIFGCVSLVLFVYPQAFTFRDVAFIGNAIPIVGGASATDDLTVPMPIRSIIRWRA